MSSSPKIGFHDKKILVTGAGRGIGKAIVAELYGRGAKVYALSKTHANLKSLTEEFPNVIPICVDLENWEETRKAVEPIEPLDCLINNAGVVEPLPILQVTPESFDTHFNVNLRGALNVSQIVAKKMITKGNGGSIVNISSVSGQKAISGLGPYCCSKAALDMLSKCLALELGANQIRVNSLVLGPVATDIANADNYEGVSNEKMDNCLEMLLRRTPTGKLFKPMSDVVNTILFLISNQTTQITGQCLALDGGFFCS
ncbi:unnamed protein product [Orchesella dallaii]|uniref:Ketoreductase domain-containing protein n=1 Tax=Orchesella dallaii TaxID=48710 RepID=A0ABP1RCL1_9HEXA